MPSGIASYFNSSIDVVLIAHGRALGWLKLVDKGLVS